MHDRVLSSGSPKSNSGGHGCQGRSGAIPHGFLPDSCDSFVIVTCFDIGTFPTGAACCTPTTNLGCGAHVNAVHSKSQEVIRPNSEKSSHGRIPHRGTPVLFFGETVSVVEAMQRITGPTSSQSRERPEMSGCTYPSPASEWAVCNRCRRLLSLKRRATLIRTNPLLLKMVFEDRCADVHAANQESPPSYL